MLNLCETCQGAGKTDTQICDDCSGVGMPTSHICDDDCNQEDLPHKRKQVRLQELREELVDLKKELGTLIAQLVTVSDQNWEHAKDKLDEIVVIRDKICGGIILNEDEAKLAFFALTLVTGETHLRKNKSQKTQY